MIVDARDAVIELLVTRAMAATICPSEVARALVTGAAADTEAADWRDMIPAVHAAVDRLVVEERVRLSWKGKTLSARAGPYRIGRGKRRLI